MPNIVKYNSENGFEIESNVLDNAELLNELSNAVLELLHKETHILFAYLYRIDVLEKDVKKAMNAQEPHTEIAILIIQKLKNRQYWRNLYPKTDHE
jgi:hypothetical protein